MKKLLIAAGALALSTAGSAAELITNGSFEAGTNPGVFTSLTAGSTAITGWTIGGAGVDYIGSYWQASDGVRSLDLSGSTPRPNGSYAGSVSQTFATVIGRTYTVRFDLAGNPDGSPLTKIVLASTLNGADFSDQYTETFQVVPGANTRENMGWVTRSFSFLAEGTQTKLNFQSGVNTAYGAALDNVSVTGSVPEPAMWAMMIGGFGLAGMTARRRRVIRNVTA